MKLLDSLQKLRDQAGRLDFGPPVTHVYNPLAYAWGAHRQYVERYARPGIRALWLGMNPGPFGMAQTGVPFGEIEAVRGWLRIEAPIQKPPHEHPKRPILGFACERSEVSGRRLWGWARERFGTPMAFFERFFVYNYCPLSFMEESGRNFTPDKLPEEERAPLFALCDEALRQTVAALKPTLVLGVGTFAEKRARAALGDSVPIARVLHPSPASPAANRGWAAAAEKTLFELRLLDPDQASSV
ncbi:MAG TPA: single-stranded DNA-binding protein [Planctomycetes bacterium]|nr:single-stranded DNA-binding protein [Planctomycetota bacterium]